MRVTLPHALDITRYWNDLPCPDARRHGRVEPRWDGDDLVVTGSLPHQRVPNLPEAPPGSRVGDLWRYDVVELFLVGRSVYLEIELGPEGRFLLLDFDAPRRLREGYVELRPELTWRSDADRWWSTLRVPGAVVPAGLRALNAFVITGEHHLAWHPVPGARPDFHQPERYPALEGG